MMQWLAQYDDDHEWNIVDVTGWDGSYRGGQLRNWQLVLEHFNLPEEIVQGWIESRLTTEVRAFHIGIMMFTGCIETWLGNTVGSIALQALKYGIPYGIVMMASGDDVTYKGFFNISPTYSTVAHMDFALEKRSRSHRGEFCSFILSKGQIIKDPIILWRRMMGQISRGKLEDVADGYFLMWMMNYSKGDALVDILTEKEAEYQSSLNHIFFNLSKIGKINKKLNWELASADSVEAPSFSVEDAVMLYEAYDLYKSDPTPLNDNAALDYYTQSLTFLTLADDD